MQVRASIAVWMCLVAFAAAAEKPADVIREEIWQTIYLNGQRVGYARVLTDPRTANGKTTVHTVAETQMKIKRFGQTLSMSTTLATEETLDGDLIEYRFAMANPPASPSQTTGRVVADKLMLVSEVDGKQKTSESAWKAGVKSPVYQDRLLRSAPLKAGESKTFEAFFPDFGKAGSMTLTAGENESIQLSDGRSQSLQKMRMSNTLLPGIITTAWVDAKGQSLKSSTNLLGTEMVTYTVSRDEALKTLSVADLDLGVSTLVKVGSIPRPYETKRGVYTVTIRDDNPTKVLPTGETQSLKALTAEAAELTVIALPIPAKSGFEAAGKEFLQSTRFLQADDEKVQAHAEAAAKGLTDGAAIARAMEKYVRDKLTKKNFSTALASAGEVARNLEGDCTEHAVLLAAMLRAKQIPSRAAVGLVYVESLQAFGGHMWTEAKLDGKWVPLDATLGRGGIGATHIKLADVLFEEDDAIAPLSSFSSLLTVMGKLTIDVVKVE